MSDVTRLLDAAGPHEALFFAALAWFCFRGVNRDRMPGKNMLTRTARSGTVARSTETAAS